MMATMGQRHWAELGEATSVGGIRVLCFVHRWLGRLPFLVCLHPVVGFYWLTRPNARRASLDYLRRAYTRWFGLFEGKPGIWHSLRHFAVFGDTLLTKIVACGGGYPTERVRLHREDMLAMLRSGRGGVIVTAHMGCLELTQMLAATVSGLRISVLVHTAHAQRFNSLLGRLGADGAVRLLQVDDLGPATAMMLGERVANGEFVAIAGDRVPLGGGRSVAANFLGAPAKFPIGPYVLASALGCPLFTMSCLRDRGGYTITFERLLECVELPRRSREAALAGHVAAYAQWLELQVRQSPYDWFNFYDFWETNDGRT